MQQPLRLQFLSGAPAQALRRASGMVLLCAWLAAIAPWAHGQTAAPSPATSAPGPAMPASASVAPQAPASAAVAAIPLATAPPPAASAAQCTACPRQLTASEAQAMVDAATTIQQAAKDLKQDGSFWTSVGVNVFSNRLDAFLFGGGAENQGMFALLAAWASLAVAVIKLLMALRLPVGTSGARRTAEVGLSLVLCLSGGLAVLAVHTARSSVAAAAIPTEQLTAALSSCQQNLQSALTNGAGTVAPPLLPSTAILSRVEAACTAARTETVARLDKIASSVQDVQGSQVGVFLKLLVFLAFCGTAFLVWLAASRR